MTTMIMFEETCRVTGSFETETSLCFAATAYLRRAQAHLKLQQYKAAAADCYGALNFDPGMSIDSR